jgi:Uma2 family endonuclease
MKTAKTKPIDDAPSNGLPASLERLIPWMNDPVLRRLQPKGMPLSFGNEDLEMGESTIHTITAGILLYGLGFHFASQANYRVFGNLNLYHSEDTTDYVSPDVMVVRQSRALPAQLASYWVGQQGPAPALVGEVLSFRTWQQGDMGRKPIHYSALGVEEYIVTDVTGEMLEQRLLLLRRQRDGSWRDEQDADGGVTSRLGFRVVLDADGQLRVLDAKTGKRYARPEEAQATADRVLALEKELARIGSAQAKAKKGKGRRPKP